MVMSLDAQSLMMSVGAVVILQSSGFREGERRLSTLEADMVQQQWADLDGSGEPLSLIQMQIALCMLCIQSCVVFTLEQIRKFTGCQSGIFGRSRLIHFVAASMAY